MTSPMRFFFYGTLIAGSRNAVAQAVHRNLCDLGPARMAGLLYAIPDAAGWYPALLPGAETVAGRLYEAMATFTTADLVQLDGWEDFDPQQPGTSLYRREILTVYGADDAVSTAQAYRFNRPLPSEALAIAGGDFHAWLEARGAKAYAEGT